MVREEAYAVVQKHAIAAFDGGASLEERVQADPAIGSMLTPEERTRVFDLSVHLKEVERIMERALRA
jgi:adenylosuccinate lyase